MTKKKYDTIKVDRNLEELLKYLCLHKQYRKALPATTGNGYNTRYEEISSYLKKNVHTEVEKGALLKSVLSKDADIGLSYLNNHGPGHVECVIKCATELLRELQCEITPYESYLLLVAIHFHDVGNILGRENHEKKAGDIMSKLGNLAGDDTAEKRKILELAAAHAGNIHGDKDKIIKLVPSIDLLCKKIRPRLLAAILRFADELADDRTRASRFLLENGLLPSESEIYHAYSNALTSVVIENGEIRLSYEIDKAAAIKEYKKKSGSVYLLDEIYERTGKMHIEKMYCMRFLRCYRCVEIEKIKVAIEVFEDPIHSTEPEEKINYTLSEAGYPDKVPANVCQSIAELKDESDGFMDGAWLKKKLIAGD